MGFLDKAKAAATDLAAKADTALSQASTSLSGGGDAERLLRDYGLLMWRQSHGQPVDDAELTRVTEALQRQDGEGRLHGLALHTTPVAAPPPPGGYQAPPPPGEAATPPPPGQSPPPPGQYGGAAGQPGPAAPEGGQSAPGTEGGQPGSSTEGGSRVPPPPPPPSGF
ncbi:hypothetical protein MWU75_18590 [Ornithinimicrobium sp. F0845]|uniref:hypothetical protein n=1 Tax=Ornithinimicrobium sp. F0845 TaxID=2926412 RepID=UPI001FF69EF9|nr:hypothetical protein [Ornithinimicrobium sp. F0845]MCK0114151.1 hypothetical protein [Ornithinimicrobium sp. F0845]